MRRSKRRSGALGGGGGGGPAQRSAAIAGRWALCRVTFLWVPELPNRDPNSACVPCRLYMNRNVYKILGVIGAVGGKGSFDQRSGRELTVELQPLRLLLTAVNWVQDRYAACCEPLGKSCRRQRGFLRAGAHEPLLAHFEVLVKAACEGLYIGFGELRPSSCPRSERSQRRRERERARGECLQCSQPFRPSRGVRGAQVPPQGACKAAPPLLRTLQPAPPPAAGGGHPFITLTWPPPLLLPPALLQAWLVRHRNGPAASWSTARCSRCGVICGGISGGNRLVRWVSFGRQPTAWGCQLPPSSALHSANSVPKSHHWLVRSSPSL